MTETSELVKRLRGPVSEAAKDLIDRYFGHSDKCLARIPADPERDADLVLTRGIREAADAIERLERERETLGTFVALADDHIKAAAARIQRLDEALRAIDAAFEDIDVQDRDLAPKMWRIARAALEEKA